MWRSRGSIGCNNPPPTPWRPARGGPRPHWPPPPRESHSPTAGGPANARPPRPRVAAAAEKERAATAGRRAAATATAPGEEFTAGGQTLRRTVLKEPSPRIWAENCDTGKRRDLTSEEEHAF